jgi:hypothetical protein
MLFKFNNFWRTLGIVMSSWIVFAVWGFELAAITLLSLHLSALLSLKS